MLQQQQGFHPNQLQQQQPQQPLQQQQPPQQLQQQLQQLQQTLPSTPSPGGMPNSGPVPNASARFAPYPTAMLLKQAQQAQVQAQAQGQPEASAQAQPQASTPDQAVKHDTLGQDVDANADAESISTQDKLLNADQTTSSDANEGDAKEALGSVDSPQLADTLQTSTLSADGDSKELSDQAGQDAQGQTANVGASTLQPASTSQASGTEQPPPTVASTAALSGIGKTVASNVPVASPSTNGPESTLGFAQAMMAVPVPVITLPPSIAQTPLPVPSKPQASTVEPEAPETTAEAPSPVPAAPLIVAYHPITRAVDTYGGIDVMAVEKYNVPHYVPGREYLGKSNPVDGDTGCGLFCVYVFMCVITNIYSAALKS